MYFLMNVNTHEDIIIFCTISNFCKQFFDLILFFQNLTLAPTIKGSTQDFTIKGSIQDLGSHQAYTILDSILTFTTQDLGSTQDSTIKGSTQDQGSPQAHTTLALPLADRHHTFQPSIQTIPTTMYLVQAMVVSKDQQQQHKIT